MASWFLLCPVAAGAQLVPAFELETFWGATIDGGAPVDCYEPCLLRVRSLADDPALDAHGDLIALDHVFSFDDPGSGDWEAGAGARLGAPRSRDSEASFVAGHVYENAVLADDCGDGPGTCDRRSPRLDVHSESESAATVATDQLEIKDWKLLWDPSAHQVLCINPFGDTDFAACPSVDPADHVEIGVAPGADDLDATLVAFGCVDQTMRCLLKAGGTYTIDDAVLFRDDAPRILGKYGVGADPVIDCSAIPELGACIGLVADVASLVFMDLDLVGPPDVPITMVLHSGAPGVRNVLMLRVDATGFNNCFHFHTGNIPVFSDIGIHNSMLWIVDSSCVGGPGLGGLDAFLAAGHSGLLGNTFGDRGAEPNDEEHNVRIKRWYRSIAAHNTIGLLTDSPSYDGCGESRLPFTLRSGFSHHAYTSEDPGWAAVDPRDFDSREFVLSDNAVQGCRRNANQFQVGPTDSGKCGSSFQDYVADGNYCWNGYNDRASPKCFLFSGHWFRVSNNVARFTAETGGASSQPRGIQLQDRRTGSDVRCDADLSAFCVQEDLDAQPHPGHFLSNAVARDNTVQFHSEIAATDGLAYCIDADADVVQFRDNTAVDGGGLQALLENYGTQVTGCEDGLPGSCNVVTAPACDNGLDDDGDGAADGDDPGCDGWLDTDERSASLPCDDGLDDDGDGLVDFGGGDPGCLAPDDPSEQEASLPCDNGLDDDGDLFVDVDDPGCAAPSWATESPACNDGLDNDGDGGIDADGVPADDHCVEPWIDEEEPAGGCGLGYELAPVLGLLGFVASRRRAERGR